MTKTPIYKIRYKDRLIKDLAEMRVGINPHYDSDKAEHTFWQGELKHGRAISASEAKQLADAIIKDLKDARDKLLGGECTPELIQNSIEPKNYDAKFNELFDPNVFERIDALELLKTNHFKVDMVAHYEGEYLQGASKNGEFQQIELSIDLKTYLPLDDMQMEEYVEMWESWAMSSEWQFDMHLNFIYDDFSVIVDEDGYLCYTCHYLLDVDCKEKPESIRANIQRELIAWIQAVIEQMRQMDEED